MELVADDVQTLVIPGCGHWVAEQAPKEMLAALTEFLGPVPHKALVKANGPGRAPAFGTQRA
jgi:hypothetical protein